MSYYLGGFAVKVVLDGLILVSFFFHFEFIFRLYLLCLELLLGRRGLRDWLRSFLCRVNFWGILLGSLLFVIVVYKKC